MKKIEQVYAATPVRAQVFRQLENAILDGEIPNEYDAAHSLMERLASERGLVKRKS